MNLLKKLFEIFGIIALEILKILAVGTFLAIASLAIEIIYLLAFH